jgi:transcriptional regulator GlxA family with amidase domain
VTPAEVQTAPSRTKIGSRPGGQAQFSTVLTLQAGDGRFDRLHAWIRENLSADLSLPALAPAA